MLPKLHRPTREDIRSVMSSLNGVDEDLLGQALLRRFEPSEEFFDHVKWLIDNDSTLQLGIDYSFLGFIKDYFLISELLTRPECNKKIIVDVGCATGLQHVFFEEFKSYIGIDCSQSGFKAFRPNASFVLGEFADLVESGRFVITDDMIGVANMSLLYGNPNKEKSLAAFDKFRKKIII